MSATIIILTYNGGTTFKECLKAVFNQKTDFPFDVICIDSGSIDGTVEVIKNSNAKLVQIHKSQFNHGGTRNLGAELSSGEIICYLVQDAVPADTFWLSELAKNFSDPKVAGVYSRQIPREGSNFFTKEAVNNWLTGRKEREERYINDEYFSLSPWEKRLFVNFDNVSSAIRRSVWEKERFKEMEFGEDVEWAKRVIEAGYKIVYEPGSTVIHSHSKTIFYTFKRAYISSKAFYELFAIKLIPGSKLLLKCIRDEHHRYINLIRAQRPETKNQQLKTKNQKKFLNYSPWSIVYSLLLSIAENFGQFAGPLSEKWKRKWFWYKPLEQFILKQ